MNLYILVRLWSDRNASARTSQYKHRDALEPFTLEQRPQARPKSKNRTRPYIYQLNWMVPLARGMCQIHEYIISTFLNDAYCISVSDRQNKRLRASPMNGLFLYIFEMLLLCSSSGPCIAHCTFHTFLAAFCNSISYTYRLSTKMFNSRLLIETILKYL